MGEHDESFDIIRELNDAGATARYLAKPENRAALLSDAVRTRAIVVDGLTTVEDDPEHRAELEQTLETGQAALKKIAVEGEGAVLSSTERIAVEAVFHLIARPAILVQNGAFAFAPERWTAPLRQERDAITANLPGIGALERTVSGVTELVGTAFLCAPGIAMTNRHVLQTFALNSAATWTFAAGYKAALNCAREKGRTARVAFSVKELIGAHPDPEIDLALLRVAPKAETGETLPQPLTISKAKPDPIEQRQVYIVGYPKVDEQHTPPEVLARIFSGIYGVKRLQPGFTLSFDNDSRDVKHDCSTLGGNSGSPLIDLAANQVIGLHYFGIYKKVNNAVALWTLAEDSFLKQSKVQFS
jgi:V8-like Glu-specific endopeptidase